MSYVPHHMPHYELATMPAFPADAQAVAALHRGEAHRAFQERRVRETMSDLCGVTLPEMFAWRTQNDGERFYVATVHDFTVPAVAEARLTLLSHKYRWTRSKLMELGQWLCFTIGLKRVVVHIHVGSFRTESIAQRAGFRLTGTQCHDESGRPVKVWSAAPEDIMFFGLRGVR